MTDAWSIAIETTSRRGGVALGRGEERLAAAELDSSRRHASELLVSLRKLLDGAGVAPEDLDEVYVSVGPGSFTGVRVGVTVARTLGQALDVRLAAAPTPRVVLENILDHEWTHAAVVLDARRGNAFAQAFERSGGQRPVAGEPMFGTPEELLERLPRPLVLVGEGLGHVSFPRPEGVELIDPADAGHRPTASGCWEVGRRLAGEGRFVDYHALRPVYTRKPEAVRLWEEQGKP